MLLIVSLFINAFPPTQAMGQIHLKSAVIQKASSMSWMMLWQLICAEKLSLFRHSVREIRLQICRKGRCHCLYYCVNNLWSYWLYTVALPLIFFELLLYSELSQSFEGFNPQYRSCWIIEHPSANFYVTTIATCVGCAAYCLAVVVLCCSCWTSITPVNLTHIKEILAYKRLVILLPYI